MSNPDFKTFPITFLPPDQPLLVASIDLPEPELVHAADITGCEALVHPRLVDYLLGRDQQCCGFSSLELPY
jgi:hypothetical protein